MMRRVYPLLFTLALLLLSLALLPSGAAQVQTLTIAFYGPPDHPAALGAQLAIDQINTEASPGDPRLSFLASTDPRDLSGAALVFVPDPPPNSSTNLAWGMPIILLSPDAPLLLPGIQGQVYRGLTSQAQLQAIELDFLTRQSGATRFLIIGGGVASQNLTVQVQQSGGVQVRQFSQSLLTAADFADLLSYNPQVIFYEGDAASAAALIQSLGQAAWRGFFVYPDPPALLAQDDFSLPLGLRLLDIRTWTPAAEDELSRRFTDTYIRRYAQTPDESALAAYDLTWAAWVLFRRAESDLATMAPISTTLGQVNPAAYGGQELYRAGRVFEYLSAQGVQILARYDGGVLAGGVVGALPTPTPIPTATPGFYQFIVTVDQLNVRTGPADEYQVIGQLNTGQSFQILGQLREGGWYLISSPYGPGWVRARFGEVFQPLGLDLPLLDAPPPPTPLPSPTGQVLTATPAAEVSLSVPAATNANFELGGQVISQEAVPLMQNIGMRWVKEQVRWERGEGPEKAAQGAIEAARARGMKILISSVGWPAEMGDLESYMNDYAAYLGGVAALGPDAIEVWNEPNLDREWPAGQVDGATYTRMLEKAYRAIKAANPNVLVISGAPGPTGFFQGCAAAGCDDDVFIRAMAAAGAAQFMDCAGVHYNEGIVPPDRRSGDPRGGHHSYYLPAMLDLYWQTFGKPLCITEIGYLTPEGYGGTILANYAWAQNTSLQDQADWLAGAVRLARGDSRLRLMIVWNINFRSEGGDPRGAFAIIRPDGSCPACQSLTTALR